MSKPHAGTMYDVAQAQLKSAVWKKALLLREFDTFLPASCVHFGANAFTLWANAFTTTASAHRGRSCHKSTMRSRRANEFTTTASAHRGRSCHKPTLRSRRAKEFITILTQIFFIFEKWPQEKINRFETLKKCIIFWIRFTVFSLSTKHTFCLCL